MANAPFGLEHPLVATRDLTALADRYAALGFAPAPEGRHPWGTANRLVMFPDNFIELIGVADPAATSFAAPGDFPFGAFVAASLDRREGVPMVALRSNDAPGDYAQAQARGIADGRRVEFRRPVTLPDGTRDEAVVTLAMMIDAEEPELSHFLCHQHRPEFVWVRDWLVHPNGADGIRHVTYAVRDLARARTRFAAIWPETRDAPGGFICATAGGEMRVLTQDAAADRFASVGLPAHWRDVSGAVAIGIRVPDPAAIAARCAAAGISHAAAGGTVQVDPIWCGNVVLDFAAS
jgi:hypothetical protein